MQTTQNTNHGSREGFTLIEAVIVMTITVFLVMLVSNLVVSSVDSQLVAFIRSQPRPDGFVVLHIIGPKGQQHVSPGQGYASFTSVTAALGM